MDFLNFKTTKFCFRFPNLFIVFAIMIFKVPFSVALSFNFTTFSPNNHNITYERAFLDPNQVIQLAGDHQRQESIGRATYSEPMLLWNKNSNKLADFTTHFSFGIDSQNKTPYGDGLAFFLAPADSRLNPNITEGGSMGLTTGDPFMAVEFDIYKNPWDPPREHVGIDVNCMRSVANVTWWSNIPEGKRNEAWISYNSSSKNLSVVFTGFRDNSTVLQYLSYEVDLQLYLPELVTFGFTAATGIASAVHSIYSWDFSSSSIDHPIGTPNPGKNNVKPKFNKLAVGFGVGGFVSLVTVCLIWLGILWKRKSEENHSFDSYMDDEFQKGTGVPKKYGYRELARATNNFNREAKLGEGGFGGVYKGFLRDIDSFVAVKRVSKDSKQGIKEYATEVKIISRLRHRNLVQLVGWCHEKRELLLVYEYMPNGSLDSHLFKENKLLTWEARYRIAQGLASALLYLQEECEQCVIHRDIKSSNVMLDSTFNAKLGDFGLARLVDHRKGSQTTILAGTMGYMALECVTTGKASRESDIYSFGIVALEIACGRKPINPKAAQDQIVMVEWVWELYGRGKVLAAADPRLGGDFDERQMERLIVVGLWCAHPDNKARPSIRQVIQVLNLVDPLPILPPELPVATYPTAIMNTPTSSLSYGSTSNTSEGRPNADYSNNTSISQLTDSSAASSPSKSLLYTY